MTGEYPNGATCCRRACHRRSHHPPRERHRTQSVARDLVSGKSLHHRSKQVYLQLTLSLRSLATCFEEAGPSTVEHLGPGAVGPVISEVLIARGG